MYPHPKDLHPAVKQVISERFKPSESDGSRLPMVQEQTRNSVPAILAEEVSVKSAFGSFLIPESDDGLLPLLVPVGDYCWILNETETAYTFCQIVVAEGFRDKVASFGTRVAGFLKGLWKGLLGKLGFKPDFTKEAAKIYKSDPQKARKMIQDQIKKNNPGMSAQEIESQANSHVNQIAGHLTTRSHVGSALRDEESGAGTDKGREVLTNALRAFTAQQDAKLKAQKLGYDPEQIQAMQAQALQQHAPGIPGVSAAVGQPAGQPAEQPAAPAPDEKQLGIGGRASSAPGGEIDLEGGLENPPEPEYSELEDQPAEPELPKIEPVPAAGREPSEQERAALVDWIEQNDPQEGGETANQEYAEKMIRGEVPFPEGAPKPGVEVGADAEGEPEAGAMPTDVPTGPPGTDTPKPPAEGGIGMAGAPPPPAPASASASAVDPAAALNLGAGAAPDAPDAPAAPVAPGTFGSLGPPAAPGVAPPLPPASSPSAPLVPPPASPPPAADAPVAEPLPSPSEPVQPRGPEGTIVSPTPMKAGIETERKKKKYGGKGPPSRQGGTEANPKPSAPGQGELWPESVQLDGQLLYEAEVASAGKDSKVRLTGTDLVRLVGMLSEGNAPVNRVSFRCCGKRLAFAQETKN